MGNWQEELSCHLCEGAIISAPSIMYKYTTDTIYVQLMVISVSLPMQNRMLSHYQSPLTVLAISHEPYIQRQNH